MAIDSQFDGWMFLFNVRISSIYLFFLEHLKRINVEPLLGLQLVIVR
jgi:hypothetical protein